ncbi:undecaprenyl-diphosphate phosphatase [Paenibacillus sp. 481]|uniref:undecaprenyl-diphosphate phosphatase n=1 Tax=Paenibacillus sp. 481 TaxID=2835869 RepID=UPI001E454BFF|nr:undecaprenyl-diphosphate phosphatase [Paenibacillus sp. 481]UHA72412.1 undecaprenyl-diphosphate phosphatase [Paenibacillus sp. 481]
MLTVLIAILLGVVEGVTEFIPVSSTGHMILTSKLLGIDEQSELLKTFEIVIQLGAIIAITVVYWQRILGLLGLSSETVQKGLTPQKRMNVLHIGLGIAPALLVAFVAKDFIKTLFSAYTVLFALIVGGIFMWAAEWYSSRRKPEAQSVDDITYKQALLIGLYQIIAVLWPGFSRSGSTISGGLLSGVSYRASADFSFIIAIPIMMIATGYEIINNIHMFSLDVVGLFALGFIVAFMVAYAVVVTFLKHIQRVRLKHFAIYRFIVAGLFWFFIME